MQRTRVREAPLDDELREALADSLLGPVASTSTLRRALSDTSVFGGQPLASKEALAADGSEPVLVREGDSSDTASESDFSSDVRRP